jgi:SAM-dependent methyltransferase
MAKPLVAALIFIAPLTWCVSDLEMKPFSAEPTQLTAFASLRGGIEKCCSKLFLLLGMDRILFFATRTLYNVLHGIYQHTVVRYSEWRFDKKWGVRTVGIIEHPRESKNPLHRSAVCYEPTSPRVFRQIMRSVGCLTAPYVFYDMGCGKGRVLLMASQYSFKRIVGVEFCHELAGVAEDNVRRLQAGGANPTQVQVVCSDAAAYRFSDENAVIFFFNPFTEVIMSKVLENIRLSARNTKDRYIVYNNPVLENLLSNPEHFSLIVKKRKYSIYRMIL